MKPGNTSFSFTIKAHVMQFTGDNQQEIADFIKKYLMPDNAISDGPNGTLDVQYATAHGRVGVSLEAGQHVVVLFDRIAALGESDFAQFMAACN